MPRPNLAAFLALLLSLVSCQAGPPPAGGAVLPDRISKTTVLVGQRQLEESEWAPVEDQFLLGAEYSSISTQANFGPEFGFNGSYASEDLGGLTLDATLLEAYLGGRIQSTTGNARPFFGAGGVLTYGEIELSNGFSSASADDTVLGFYLHGGLSVRASESLEIVFDVRKRFGSDAEIEGVEIDVDYLTFAIGFSF
ncbi:hypothetical protein Poly30_28540 [Planctomycetes bacterium Poly30]|uniref:Outer membrane protein beta-barrel domain-containing protein n=1 Tax=Saltatorellus ferox TaxID=2528018 RepID=A0A518ETB0_9BACT|nr:hypothetical protein Poly30_28540 [Planctomycetes bacterium Poly30]